MAHCCYLSVSDEGPGGQYKINGPERYTKCMGKCKYGPYCYKHRSLHLIENNMIIPERFTGLAKDYLIRDLRNCCKVYKDLIVCDISSHILETHIKTSSKADVFTIVSYIITKLKLYKTEESISKFIKIQGLFRGFQERYKYRCNNQEDFFTFEGLREIPKIYYFSYKDNQGFRWGFDVRSLTKLLDMGYSNPYTTEVIPPSVVQDIKAKIRKLRREGISIEVVDEVVQDRSAIIKQRVVDLFSKIEQAGYSCNISWFLELDIPRLRELYKQLEDVWNYRSQLTRDMRREICPPDGRMFVFPVSEIMNYQTKEMIQECLLGELSKFSISPIESNQKLGYMYFIIGLGYVSPPCFQVHQDWLAFIN